jgi:hypothetical protein
MSIVSNHFPELLDGLGEPEPWFGRPPDEPTEEDWQDFSIWLARVNAGLPPALPEFEEEETEAEHQQAVERHLRAMNEPAPW